VNPRPVSTPSPSILPAPGAQAGAAPALPRLGAVVVLFLPSEAQIDHLLGLAERQLRSPAAWPAAHHRGDPAALGGLIVIDNTVQPDPVLHRRLAEAGVACLSNFNRGGIAGAFNQGAAWLADQGMDAFLLLDQDSVPEETFVPTMVRVCAERLAHGESRFLLGPRIFDVNAGRHLPVLEGSRWSVRRVRPGAAPGRPLLPCSFMISSGCVVSRAAWQALGGWREDFVIDHVDTEYSLRAARHGIPLWLVSSLTLHHSIGGHVRRSVLGISIGAMNHGPARRYYLARNGLALAQAGHGLPLAVLLVNLLTLWQFATIWLVECDKLIKTRALCAGLLDGMLARLGPLEARRPALAGRCQQAVAMPLAEVAA
jgi:rhamnosyltransferase